MGIVGPFPESGLRLELERPREGGPPWIYTGHAVTPTERIEMRAAVEADGAVQVEGPPAAVADKARLIVRAAWKNAAEGGEPPPRRIVRWRGPK